VHATTRASLVFMGLPDEVDRAAMRRVGAEGGEPKFQKSNARFISKKTVGQRPTSAPDDRLSPVAANHVGPFETFPIVAR
jgi:hypothetical protein